MAIPKEYLDSEFDFGFSTTEDNVIPVVSTPQVTSQEISEPIIERLKNLEINLGDALTILERIENAGTSLDTEEYKALIQKDVKDKLDAVEKLILPLLVNLMKNPEKDTIKWPGRGPIIEKQIEKILKITRS
jgi:hypothetical protein